MSTPESTAVMPAALVRAQRPPVLALPGLRALAWQNDVLFASDGYSLSCAHASSLPLHWQSIGCFRPALWRNLGAKFRLSTRLFGEGFHALALLSQGHLVAAVPGAIISMAPGETEFRVSHPIQRGTRPLHITATPQGRFYWGEYFNNPRRDEVHIYVSEDCGFTWEIGYTFPEGAIRHVHNIVFDEFENCLWILTGDEGEECRILRASHDFRSVDVALSGNQQARAVALVPMRDAVYFATDTPSESNHIYRLGRNGSLSSVAQISSSSVSGCRVGHSLFFSTMVEPTKMNPGRRVKVYRSSGGTQWEEFLHWEKDFWPMKFFQYGNAFFPTGNNSTGLLALSTVAVAGADLQTALWRI
jgi:hypothetical protein